MNARQLSNYQFISDINSELLRGTPLPTVDSVFSRKVGYEQAFASIDLAKIGLFKTLRASLNVAWDDFKKSPATYENFKLKLNETVPKILLGEHRRKVDDSLIFEMLSTSARITLMDYDFRLAYKDTVKDVMQRLITSLQANYSASQLRIVASGISRLASITDKNAGAIQNATNFLKNENAKTTHNGEALNKGFIWHLVSAITMAGTSRDQPPLIKELSDALLDAFNADILTKEWFPYLLAIPQLRQTTLAEHILAQGVDLNVYHGITPAEVLLYSAEKQATINPPLNGNTSLSLWVGTFEDLVARGMDSDKLLDAINSSSTPYISSEPPLFYKLTGTLHQWDKCPDLLKAFKDWGGFKLIPDTSRVEGISDNFIESCVRKGEPPQRARAILEAIATFDNVTAHHQGRKIINGILNWLTEPNKDGFRHAAETFLKTGLLDTPWSPDSGVSLRQALLAGPFFAKDRAASIIDETNVFVHVLGSLSPLLLTEAISAGHTPYRDIFFKNRAQAKTFLSLSAQTIFSRYLDNISSGHRVNTFIPKDPSLLLGDARSFMLNNLQWLHSTFLLLNMSATPDADYYATLGVLLTHDERPLSDREATQIMCRPESAIVGLTLDLINLQSLEPLSKIFDPAWSAPSSTGDAQADISDNERLAILEKVFQQAVADGITPQTIMADKDGLPLEEAILMDFGEPGLAILNKVCLGDNPISTRKRKSISL